MRDAYELVNAAWDRGLIPPPDMLISEWAEENRILGESAPAPGPYRFSRTPYMREITDCLSPSSTAREVDFEKGTQIGGTEAGINWLGYIVANSLGNTMIVLPSQDVAKEWSQQRLTNLIDSTPSLEGRIAEARKRDGGNATFSKRFGGCFLKFAWATSSKKLRSTPAPNILADEVDDFLGDVEGEGDPIAILRRRFANFPRGKFLRISSPKLGHNSRIHRGFQEGDQRYFFLPCPECGHFQRLVFARLKWEKGKPETVRYCCVACDHPIPERFKTQMLSRGVWVATAGREDLVERGFADLAEVEAIRRRMAKAKHASFHLSALYSPLGWYSWSTVAEDWEKAHDDVKLKKAFFMTVLGEPWQDRGRAQEWQVLYERRDQSREPGAPIPAGGLFLTAGVDVQADRIEVEVVAWGRRWHSWSIDYQVFRGNTEHSAVWGQLNDYLQRDFPHSSGATLPIMAMAIDSGHNPKAVYEFAERNPQPVYDARGARIGRPRTVIVTKGGDSYERVIESVTSEDAAKKRSGLRIYWLGTHYLKQEFVIDWLQGKPVESDGTVQYPVGYCDFPNYEPWVFQGYCSESRVVSDKGRISWVKDPRYRNEPLDCRNGARAAAEIYAGRIQDQQWSELENWIASSVVRAGTQTQGRGVRFRMDS